MKAVKQATWPTRIDTRPRVRSGGVSLEEKQIEVMAQLSEEYRVSASAIIRQAIRVGLPTVCRMLASDRRKGLLRTSDGE